MTTKAQGLSTFTATEDELAVKSKAELVKIFHEEFDHPLGSAKGMTKAMLVEGILSAQRNQETHAAIARVASKPVGLF